MARSREAGARRALVLTLLLGFLLVGTMTVLAGSVYDAVVESDGVATLDRPVLDAAVAHRSATGNTLVTAFTNLGGTPGMSLLATAAALLIARARRSWTPIALIAATAAGSVTLTVIGKAVVGRTRPPVSAAVPPYESSFSFPSGHSLNSVAIAGVVAYLLTARPGRSRHARAAIITASATFAVLIGLSRVYLGHHWLTDVLVAWAIGLAWLTIVIVAHRLYLGRARRATTGPPRVRQNDLRDG